MNISKISKELKIRTLSDLKVVLLDEIERIKSGKSSPARVNAIAKASTAILIAHKMEMDLQNTEIIKPVKIIDIK